MILFYGRTYSNSGPDNLNREIYASLDGLFLPAGEGSFFRDILKLPGCRAVLVSGLSRRGCALALAAKCLGKRAVYLLHGCAAWEAEANGTKNAGPVRQERFLLRCCHRIITVSKGYRDFLAERYPQYAGKLSYWHPGMPEISSDKQKKIPGSILAAGADRPLKNNLPLAKAVEELGGAFSLEICGAAREDPFADFRHSRYVGLLPREEYREKLARAEIFVVNSTRESFGISPLEALACGCSLLISRGTGAEELLELEEMDIISDPLDTEELRSKLLWVHTHPNCHRLALPRRSWERAIAELASLCERGQP